MILFVHRKFPFPLANLSSKFNYTLPMGKGFCIDFLSQFIFQFKVKGKNVKFLLQNYICILHLWLLLKAGLFQVVPVSLSVYYCCYLAAFVNFCFIYFIIIRIINLCFNKLYTYFLMHLKSYICLNIADKCLLHSLLDLLLFIQQKCFLCLPINEIKVRHVIHIYIISISWNFASYINRTSSKVKGF